VGLLEESGTHNDRSCSAVAGQFHPNSEAILTPVAFSTITVVSDRSRFVLNAVQLARDAMETS